jgi:hypothetical protein
MRQKLFAAGIGIALTSLAAVGAFASQDGVQVLEETPTVEATETPIDATETPVDGTATPESTSTPDEGTPTPDATGTPEATATGEPEATETPGPEETATSEPEATPTEDGGEGEEDDVHGIPDSNPVKHPEDGDGVCEKGETVVKTTPSGNQVNVPCHAAKNSGQGGDDGEGEGTTEAQETQPKKNKGRGRR